MLTVLSVIGTRPEAIKMAPVLRELSKYPDRVRSVVCVTGQHRQMLDQMLELFNIRPDHDLNVMAPAQKLSQLTANLFTKLDPVVEETRPDWILAQGDTTTVLVASIVAFYRAIRFGHVEAGLRTGNLHNPFPEEMNRCIADRLANAYFTPTQRSRQILLDEGVLDSRIVVTGNTGIDALLTIAELECGRQAGPLFRVPLEKPLVLITAHRRESFGPKLREICLAIRDLASAFGPDGIHFVYPVHLNSNVRKPVLDILSDVSNMILLDPLDYVSMVHLMKHSILILTDSGGIQEEAPSVGVPVLVMRDTTERPEGIEAGVALLAGTERSSIVEKATYLIRNRDARNAMVAPANPYGDGFAAARIVSFLLEGVAKPWSTH